MNQARRTTAVTATAVVLTTAGGLLAATAAPASAAVSCTSPVYKRQFFANTAFSGTAKKTDCDNAIDQSWSGAPATGLPTNNFGVRWTVTRDFGSGGPFTFTASGRDGIRVYLDGTRKINLWSNTTSSWSKNLNLTIPKGKHTLRIDYANWTGAAKVKFTYKPRTSASVDKVKPLPPTGTSVSYDRATGKTKITWAKNKEMDLAGYRVYRRLKSTDSWQRIAAPTSTGYTDSPPRTGDAYYYEVRAVDRAGNESVPDRTAPAVPSGVTATDGQPGIMLAWKAVPGAAEYLVHRRWDDDGGGNPVVQVATVKGDSWLDAGVKENLYYSYWITAVDTAGNRSAKSAPAQVAHGDHAPSAPTGVTATPKAGSGIALTWKAATAPAALDLGHFRIYRNGRLFREVSAARTSYTDTSVRHSTSYTYTVTAVDTQDQESAPSAPITGTAPATGLAPTAVAGLRGAMNGNDIELVWQQNPEEDDVAHYDVYRGVLVDGSWQYEHWDEAYHRWDPYYTTASYVHEIYDPEGETVRWAVVAVDWYGNSRFTSGEDFSHVTVTEPTSDPGTE